MSVTETHVNFLGGSPLNRLSWLRPSTNFLNAAIATPATRWLLFRDGQPLVQSASAPAASVQDGVKARSRGESTMATLPTALVSVLLGPAPVFGQGREEGEHAPEGVTLLEAARLHGPSAVFLGLDERPDAGGDATTSADGADLDFALASFTSVGAAAEALARLRGVPYFALDVSEIDSGALDEVLKKGRKEGEALEFVEPRAATTGWSAFEAAVFAEARSMLDWNTRNKFCPACGSRVYTIWAGWKLVCASLLPWVDTNGAKPCPSARGVHNFSHPRTDAVVIMAVIDDKADKILLGRNRRFPDGFYSTLAGFIEPGESFEDAVRREIWEEAGVRVWGVKYHSGQPWPYPANLMVGFYAFADSTQPVRLDLDNELIDARWYTRAELRAVLAHPQGARISRREYKRFDDDDKPKPVEAHPSVNAPGTRDGTGHAALAPADPAVQRTAGAPASTTTAAGTAADGAAKGNAQELPPPPFRVPPLTAIAGVLIRDWVDGKYGRPAPVSGAGGEEREVRRGNL